MSHENKNLPPPLIPAEVDLRDFPFMPLDVDRLRDSDLAALASAEEFRAAVLLWCASWHQLPAASLPNNDHVLASIAGFGRGESARASWLAVRDGALAGFIECSDGRLYHPVVAEKALEAWQRKLAQAAKREEHRQRMETWREKKSKKDGDLSSSDGKLHSSKSTVKHHGDDHVNITGESRDDHVISLTGIGTGTEIGTGTGNKLNTLSAAAQPHEHPSKPKRQPKAHSYSDDFEAFWAIYPRPVNKLAAAKAFEKAIAMGGGTPEAKKRLLEATTAYAAHQKGKDQQYIPHPATWLNAGGWDDIQTQIQADTANRPAGYVPMGVGG